MILTQIPLCNISELKDNKMGNWEKLKDGVIQAIHTNGNQSITGDILQSSLLAIINNLGEHAKFAGVAVPNTVAITNPDGHVFYLASEAGTYANFGGAVILDGELVIFTNNSVGEWDKTVINTTSVYDSLVNISTKYSENHILQTYTLTEALSVVPNSDRSIGFTGKYYSILGWSTITFIGTSLNVWTSPTAWIQNTMSEGVFYSTSNILPQSGYLKMINEYIIDIRIPKSLDGQEVIINSVEADEPYGRWGFSFSLLDTRTDTVLEQVYDTFFLEYRPTGFQSCNLPKSGITVFVNWDKLITTVSGINSNNQGIKVNKGYYKTNILDSTLNGSILSSKIQNKLGYYNELGVPIFFVKKINKLEVLYVDDASLAVITDKHVIFKSLGWNSPTFPALNGVALQLAVIDGNGNITMNSNYEYLNVNTASRNQTIILTPKDIAGDLYQYIPQIRLTLSNDFTWDSTETCFNIISPPSIIQTSAFKKLVTSNAGSRNIIIDKSGKGDYATISEASASEPAETTFIIYPGIYDNEVVLGCKDKKQYFIGIDPLSTIVKNNKGDYSLAPFLIGAGAIKNLTIIAEQALVPPTGSLPYGIHVERDTLYNNSLIIENCYVHSYYHAAIGMGMRGGCNVILKNCKFTSDANVALYIHDAENITYVGLQKFSLINSICSSNGSASIHLQSQARAGTIVEFEFVNNVFHSNASFVNVWQNRPNPGELDFIGFYTGKLMPTSFGNSIADFNSVL